MPRKKSETVEVKKASSKVKNVVETLRKEKILTGGGGAAGDWLNKFTPGEYYNLRVLPSHENMDTIWVRHTWHSYGPAGQSHAWKLPDADGGRMITCLEAHGKGDCPVCQLKRHLLDEEEDRIAQTLPSAEKYLMNVILRGEGFRIWSASKSAAKDIQRLVLNPAIGDITDPMKGWDVSVTLTEDRPQRYIVSTTKQCAIGDKDWASKIKDLNEVVSYFEPIEIVKILNFNLGHMVDLREVFGDLVQPIVKAKKGKK